MEEEERLLLSFLMGVEQPRGDPGVGPGDTGVREGERTDWLLVPRELSHDQDDAWRVGLDRLGDLHLRPAW